MQCPPAKDQASTELITNISYQSIETSPGRRSIENELSIEAINTPAIKLQMQPFISGITTQMGREVRFHAHFTAQPFNWCIYHLRC